MDFQVQIPEECLSDDTSASLETLESPSLEVSGFLLVLKEELWRSRVSMIENSEISFVVKRDGETWCFLQA